jgi:hypothetical protein
MLAPFCHGWKYLNWRRRISGLILTVVPGLLWAILSMHYVASPFVRGQAYRPGPLWLGDPGRVFHTTDAAAQFQVFLHNPLLTLELPLHEWRPELISLRVREMVGVLGQLDVLLPHRLYLLWYLALFVTVGADMVRGRDEAHLDAKASVFVGIAAIILSCITVYDVQYLSWTLVGAADIDGVQGRYALPLLAFLAPALPAFYLSSRRVTFNLVRSALMLPAVGAAACGLVVLPHLILVTYYLR